MGDVDAVYNSAVRRVAAAAGGGALSIPVPVTTFEGTLQSAASAVGCGCGRPLTIPADQAQQ